MENADLIRKRPRSVNFNPTEEAMLLQLVKKFRATIECKKTDVLNNRIKDAAWNQLAEEFNAAGGQGRDAKTLRSKYENIKKVSKKKFANEKRYLNATGEGPAKKIITTDVDEQVKELLGTGMESMVDDDCEESDIVDIEELELLSNATVLMEKNTPAAPKADDVIVVCDTQNLENRLILPSTSKVDWGSHTAASLRTPRSKPLVVKKGETSSSGKKPVLRDRMNIWAANKAEKQMEEKQCLQELHEVRLEILRDERKFKSEEHQLRMEHLKEIHALNKEMKLAEIAVIKKNL
uniref:Regulatory protein zeste n=1 Tax=Photinus pyralis TaxID=7054 RepID=A0A1Y1KC08_PHOPY